MKIIIGTESYPPHISGVSVHTNILAKFLSKNNKVLVITPNVKSNSEVYEKINDNLTIYRTRSIKNPYRKYHRLSIITKKETEKIFSDFKPDIVHIHDCGRISSNLIKISNKANIPIVATHHFDLKFVLFYLKPFFKFHKTIEGLLKFYLKNFYKKCDLLIVPSNIVKKELSSWKINIPIYVVSNGVNLKKFSPENHNKNIYKKFNLPPNKRLIIYIGRIVKEKNLDLLIKVIPIVIKSFDVHFVIGGYGDETKNLKKLAKKLKIEKYLTFTGKISRGSNLSNLYKAGYIFVIPSPIETQSIVTLEAMASNLPIVAANSGALPELVKDGVNGFLFDKDSYEDLAEKIMKILKDEKLKDEMGKNSRKIVEENHNLNKSLRKIFLIYKRLVKNV